MKSRLLPAVIVLLLLNICLFGCSGTGLATLEIVNGTLVQSVTDKVNNLSDTSSAVNEYHELDTQAVTIYAAETVAAPPETAETEVSIETSVEILPETTPENPSSTKITDVQTTASTDTTASDKQTGVVYWVKNGEVWHLTLGCSSLSRSKDILTGTISEAVGAGKERVCKRCGE